MSGSGRIAVVTGAGTGIGKAGASALLADGWRVVLAGRDKAKLAAVDGGTAVVADVRDPASVAALFDRVEAEFGRLDLLFNNAGVFGRGGPVDQVSDEDWDDVVATNLSGAFRCARAAFAMMRRQTPRGGRIINNGSVSAHVPRPYAVAYTATKHAITGLTKALALEGRSIGITCGQIDIGNAATAMTDPMPRGMPQADGSIAPEPVMDVAAVAATVLHIANLPADVNVPFVTVMASGMPLLGRG
ncbi:MAG TPA: SDR family oxidoreductase [Pseudonocardiaceae bacterium]|nr:SDR family oxidoreductase [Pseudonocardiaceae bacterium]